MLEMRAARDADDLKPLWLTAFLPDDVFFTRDYRPERALIYTSGGKPVSMLHMLPRVILAGGRALRAGYIMGVATDPEYRRQGLAGNLISAAMGYFIKQGLDCAFLIPASAELARYYQRFGLTLRGRMPRVEAETSGLRQADNGDIPALSAMYEAAFPDRVERGVFEWETVLLEYTVKIGVNGYTVADGTVTHESLPVPRGAEDSERAACIRPFTAGAGQLLAKRRPYINLLYT